MTALFYLMVTVSLLSVLAESISSTNYQLEYNSTYGTGMISVNRGNVFFVFVIALILSLFSGLRTSFNDTYVYINGFIHNIPTSIHHISDFGFSLGEYPGFFLYQVLIKHYISTDPQVFLLLSAFIANFLFVFFYYKYSPKISLTIFLFIASGLFVFGMAAMKQIFAMSIGIWAIHYALKGKWLFSILLIILASTIHPYVLFYGFTPLLKNKVWSLRESLILLMVITGALYFDNLVALITDLHTLIREDVGFEDFLGVGVNRFRVIVYSVTPILSFFCREQLRAINNPMLNVSVNFSIISFAFMFLALLGNPVLFGRMAIYFDPLAYLALTYILTNCIKKDQQLAVIVICIVSFTIYFYYQFALIQPFVYRSILGYFY